LLTHLIVALGINIARWVPNSMVDLPTEPDKGSAID